MDNSNEPANVPTENTTYQDAPTTAPTSPVQQSARSHRNKLHVILVAVIIFVLLTLIPAAYMFGKSQSIVETVDNVNLGTNSASELKTTEEIEKPAVEIADPYKGWNTFENEVYGYSFRYPSDWQVNSETIQGQADWVSINPAERASSGEADVVAIFTYFDGTGCPETKSTVFQVGEYFVKGTACVGGDLYKISMKHSKSDVANSNGVVLARAASDAIGIQVDLSYEDVEIVGKILKSIEGLKP